MRASSIRRLVWEHRGRNIAALRPTTLHNELDLTKKRAKPGTSAACIKLTHYACFKLNCDCNCHTRGA